MELLTKIKKKKNQFHIFFFLSSKLNKNLLNQKVCSLICPCSVLILEILVKRWSFKEHDCPRKKWSFNDDTLSFVIIWIQNQKVFLHNGQCVLNHVELTIFFFNFILIKEKWHYILHHNLKWISLLNCYAVEDCSPRHPLPSQLQNVL